MKIILTRDVKDLGSTGDIVVVKDGYARNYLIPKGMALLANKQNLIYFEEQKKVKEFKKSKALREAQKLANRLSKLSLTATVQVGEDDKVFGAVTSQTIADLVNEKGIELSRKQIILDEPIKALGIYTIPVKLHPEVTTELKVWVIKE